MVNPSTAIYTALYILIHSLFHVLDVLFSVFASLRTKLVEFCHEFSPVNKTKTLIFPKKIPKHVTVLLGLEEPSLKDLANLTLWCLAAGISFISFYDYKGLLKENEEKLQVLVNKKKHHNDHVIFHPTDISKNGYSGRKIHVKLLCIEDRKQVTVEIPRKIVQCENDFSVTNLDRVFGEVLGFPEPDMGVFCGGAIRLYGYPPWQIRVTEFVELGSHHNVTLDEFVGILDRFSQCEQRFGK